MSDIDVITAEWKKAQDLASSGDKAGALFLFRKIAGRDFPYAFFEVGNLLEFGGDGLKPDVTEAVKWYEKAAEAINDEYAIFALARLYYTGQGVEKDYPKSFQYFSMLQDSKQPGAIYILGTMYEKGWGADQSTDKALHYYEKAARAGHLLALTRLGVLNLRKFNLVFGLRCLLRARLAAAKVYFHDPTDWRIGIRRLTDDQQDQITYSLTLLD